MLPYSWEVRRVVSILFNVHEFEISKKNVVDRVPWPTVAAQLPPGSPGASMTSQSLPIATRLGPTFNRREKYLPHVERVPINLMSKLRCAYLPHVMVSGTESPGIPDQRMGCTANSSGITHGKFRNGQRQLERDQICIQLHLQKAEIRQRPYMGPAWE